MRLILIPKRSNFMKKFFVTLVCAVLAAFTVVGFTACNNRTDAEKVNLVGMGTDASGVVPRDDIDYFVVPEPAASAKVKQTSSAPNGFQIVGDLQQLYGGDNGYPQAVVVIKNSLGTGDWITYLFNALSQNAEWLQADTTEISTIVNAVSDNLTAGMSPSLNANNLTKQVIANCGIRMDQYSYYTKEETKSYLTDLKAIQSNINDNPANSFFMGEIDVPTDADREEVVLDEISIYAPDGAPALALAGLMAGEIDTSNVAEKINYHIVDASTIQTHVTGATPDADICILPVNLAVNLLGNGEKYTMLGTVTHGNLYIVSAKTGEQITVENLSELKGKTVGVVNLAAIPGLTFKLILNKYGIEYTELS